MCLLARWPLDFSLRVLLMILLCVCSNKQRDTTMEHTSTICNMIDNSKHLKSVFIHEIKELATMRCRSGMLNKWLRR
jgi:hypothetical protein